MGTRGLFAAALSAVFVAGHAPVSVAASTGTIQGHVRLKGPAPGNPIIRMGMDPMCAAVNAGPARPVQEMVKTSADGGLTNVFVTL